MCFALYLKKIEWWNLRKLCTMRSTKRQIQEQYTTQDSCRVRQTLKCELSTPMWLWLLWNASINSKIKGFGWSLVLSPKTTLDASSLTNYFTNLDSHSAKHCHSNMPSLGVIRSSFNRVGKIKPFKLLEKNSELQEVFLNLPHSEGISNDIKSIIESFVCQISRRKKANSADQARLEIFVTKCKPKQGSDSLNQFQAKKFDSSIMPPCSKVLHQKIKRCIYVASIWMNSLRAEPTPHLPTSFSWTLDEDRTYWNKWFEGDVSPKIVEVVKDNPCTGYGEFCNCKIQTCLLKNNGGTNFNHSAFFLISSN